MTDELRVWWGGLDVGWVVDTPMGLSDQAMKRIADFVLQTQEQRAKGLMLGAVRDECLETIASLRAGRIRQNIVGSGDHPLFDVYKSGDNSPIMSLPQALR